MNSEEKISRAAWKGSAFAVYEIRPLTLTLLKDLHDLLGNNSSYALEDDRRFKWSAEQKFFSTAPAVRLVFITRDDDVLIPCESSEQHLLVRG